MAVKETENRYSLIGQTSQG